MTRNASAQDAPAIQRNDYSLEIFQGPLLAPGRITGLAGATAASAQSLEGVYNNAAAPAVREATSFKRFEWEPSAGISFPGAYGGTDFANRGEKGIQRQVDRNKAAGINRPPTVETTDRFLYLNAGLWGQLGSFGITATADVLRYEVESVQAQKVALAIARFHLSAAYGFLNNQLVVGAGVRMAYVDVDEVDKNDPSVLSMFGVAPQAGFVIKPEGRQWRVGFTARAPVSASTFSLENLIRETQPDGTTIRRAGTDFILPARIVQPWEIEWGVAYQLGPRPLNPSWIDPIEHRLDMLHTMRDRRLERAAAQRAEIASMPGDTVIDRGARAARLSQMAREEAVLRQQEDAEIATAEDRLYEQRRARYLNWPREYVTLLASVVATGASGDAVALEGFIDQRREIVGNRVTVAPRIALESEVVPNLLKSRAGVYLEPSRFTDGTVRQHFTLGFDVRLFAFSVFGLFPDYQWRVTMFADIAERYQNFGIGFGTWH